MFRHFLAAATLIASPLLAQGQPNLVLNLEGYLAELGFNPGVVDGQIDQATYAAITAYQTARGLPVTGGMTVPEYQALEAEALAARQVPTTVGTAPVQAPRQVALKTIVPPRVPDDITYYEIETCQAERGIGYVWYVYAAAAKALLALTDICLDRTAGTFDALEPQSDLTLVRDVEGNQFYEVISSGEKVHERKRMTLGNYQTSEDPLRYGAVTFDFQDNYKGTRLAQGANNHSVTGFVTETSFPPERLAGPMNLWISGHDFMKHSTRKDGARFGSQTAYFGFQGQMTFEGGLGTAVLKDTGEGDGTGTGNLVIEIDPTGKITGSGAFSLQNARLAGVNPADWKTTNWTIVRLLGMTAGSEGQELRAVAIATGMTVDHDGTQTPVYATVSIIGYGPKYAAE